MRTIQSGIAAALGTAAMVATFTLACGSTANAATTGSTSPAQSTASCWMDITTGQSLCVPNGVNLISTVEAETGTTISVPTGIVVGNVTAASGLSAAPLLSASSASTSKVVSALYDDINYGGGTYLMTADGAGCEWGISNLGNFGWNDRASSFKSYSGCETAVFKDINFGGTQLGYATNKASFGSMNDAASSWATE